MHYLKRFRRLADFSVCSFVRRQLMGVGLPVLVCSYSAGVTNSIGRGLMKPLLDMCRSNGLTDAVVVGHHNESPYDKCETFSEYVAAVRDAIIAEQPDRLGRPWVLVAHSHGSNVAYGLARLLGPKVRQVLHADVSVSPAVSPH